MAGAGTIWVILSPCSQHVDFLPAPFSLAGVFTDACTVLPWELFLAIPNSNIGAAGFGFGAVLGFLGHLNIKGKYTRLGKIHSL